MFELTGFRRAASTFVLVASAVSMLAGSACPVLSKDPVLPAKARPMTPQEIYMLYKNKSWRWKNGAGLMNGIDRTFSAWSDDGKSKSWAEGRWVITATGLMCFKATWHTEKGQFPDRSCFAHRIASGTIYQRREPKGSWYVFRHPTTKEGDEASNLIDGDLVSQQRDVIRAALSATSKPVQ